MRAETERLAGMRATPLTLASIGKVTGAPSSGAMPWPRDDRDARRSEIREDVDGHLRDAPRAERREHRSTAEHEPAIVRRCAEEELDHQCTCRVRRRPARARRQTGAPR
jgi:hypothetical protein